MSCQLTDSRWYLVGLASFGPGCAKDTTPDVYTRVSYFSDWIFSTIESHVSHTRRGGIRPGIWTTAHGTPVRFPAGQPAPLLHWTFRLAAKKQFYRIFALEILRRLSLKGRDRQPLLTELAYLMSHIPVFLTSVKRCQDISFHNILFGRQALELSKWPQLHCCTLFMSFTLSQSQGSNMQPRFQALEYMLTFWGAIKRSQHRRAKVDSCDGR